MLRSSHDACGCSTQTTSTINLKRSTLHPHEGQADRPNTPSDSVNLGSNPGPPARESARIGLLPLESEHRAGTFYLRSVRGSTLRRVLEDVRAMQLAA